LNAFLGTNLCVEAGLAVEVFLLVLLVFLAMIVSPDTIC
jgi:hypothetical protein